MSVLRTIENIQHIQPARYVFNFMGKSATSLFCMYFSTRDKFTDLPDTPKAIGNKKGGEPHQTKSVKAPALQKFIPLLQVRHATRGYLVNLCLFYLNVSFLSYRSMHGGQSCQIVVVLSVNALLAQEAMLIGIHGEGVKVDV